MTASSHTPRVLIEPRLSRFLFADTRLAPLWALLRSYVGWQWLQAGWHKVTDSAWVGPQAGTAITGFLNGALAKTGGERPSVSGWYGSFVENVALPNATLFSYLVTFGELAVGTALILGLLTGIAAFFGGLMNAHFLLAGTLSTNPLLFILATWLVLAWRVAGWWGLDRWVLPRLGVSSAPGPGAGTPGPRAEPRPLR